jgi:two-component system chemotaxis sensor kinase CheA
MISLEEQSTVKAELLQVLDDLALQVMVQGADALTPAAFASLTKLAERCDLADFAKEVKAAKPAKGKSVTEDGARAIIEKLQALIAAPTEQELKEEAAKVAPTAVPESFAFEEDPELLADFVMESEEHLTAIEEKILLLEKDPTLIDTIHAVFRSFHSIKGLAGFLGLVGVQTVAHEVETLLDHARNSRISVTSDVVDLVLESSEYLKEEVAVVDAKLNGIAIPAVRDNTNLIKVLSTATADIAAGRPFSIAEPKPDAAAPAVVAAVPTIAPVPVEAPIIVAVLPEVPRPAIAPAILPPPPVAAVAPPPAEKQARTEPTSTSIRVETSKLDRLMDMVGEMVIAQAILSNSRAGVPGEITQLARITSEVQRCAMSMRMMPIGPLFQKNAKMVRDLSRRNGKQVSLELLGESTELDKTIAEELSDPLLHMIRNALDHGIEPPDERIAAGKNPIASLRIGAEHQAGQIVISIADDGRGLDPQRIRNKAIQNGLIEEAAQLTEEEIFHLIFAPGFSTAEKITDISGRGVGMDVVRQHVESLRGRIEIHSVLGQGTTFRILLPLTLAIIEGLVIVVGVHRYIIPLFSVREMLRPTQDMLFTVQGSDEMILMRGSLLPLIRLHKRFDVIPRTEDICDGLLVVCEFSGKRFCLFVDDLQGRQEVVIKSLDESFKSVKGLVGSAILGDGRIGLILDVAGIFQRPYPGQELNVA